MLADPTTDNTTHVYPLIIATLWLPCPKTYQQLTSAKTLPPPANLGKWGDGETTSAPLRLALRPTTPSSAIEKKAFSLWLATSVSIAVLATPCYTGLEYEPLLERGCGSSPEHRCWTRPTECSRCTAHGQRNARRTRSRSRCPETGSGIFSKVGNQMLCTH